MSINLNKNGQWKLEGLEKMAYYQGRDKNKDKMNIQTRQFEYMTSHYPHQDGKHESSTATKGKNGEQLYHHIFTLGEARHHILSEHKDISKEGVAGGWSELNSKKGVSVDTAEGEKDIKDSAAIMGIGVNNESNKGKGYGKQMFHNIAHYHGNLIGDYAYTTEGEALTDSVAKHKAYNHIDDTKDQSYKEAKAGATRRVFEVKDKKTVGKIPEKYLG